MRTFLSILAGAVLWAILWGATNATGAALVPDAFGADGSVHHTGILATYVVVSLGLSLLAGWTTARIARDRAMLAAGILAAIQLSIGIFVEASYWELIPVWYHLTFLTLLVPGILAGARVGRRDPSALAPAVA